MGPHMGIGPAWVAVTVVAASVICLTVIFALFCRHCIRPKRPNLVFIFFVSRPDDRSRSPACGADRCFLVRRQLCVECSFGPTEGPLSSSGVRLCLSCESDKEAHIICPHLPRVSNPSGNGTKFQPQQLIPPPGTPCEHIAVA